MKSSMTLIQSNGWTEIDFILKQKWRRFIWWQVSFNLVHAEAWISLFNTKVSWFLYHGRTIDIDYFSFLYVPKRLFYDANVGKLEKSSRTTLRFQGVYLWRHNHFTRETRNRSCSLSSTLLWMTDWLFWANRVDNSVNMGEICFAIHECITIQDIHVPFPNNDNDGYHNKEN